MLPNAWHCTASATAPWHGLWNTWNAHTCHRWHEETFLLQHGTWNRKAPTGVTLHVYAMRHYHKHKKFCGGNIFAIIAGTIIIPRKYSPRIVYWLILVTLNLAINLLWNFLTLRYCKQSLKTIYQTPRGHLPHQFCDRPPQKLASRYTRRQSRKRWRRGAMVTLTRRPVHEQASNLARTISSHCQTWIKGNQASGELLSLRVGCTARKDFHANISAVHVTAFSVKFIARKNFYVYGIYSKS